MSKLYAALMQRFAPRTLHRQPEMDILMVDHAQNAEYLRDGEDGSLAIVYDLIVNALLRLAPVSGKALDICCGSASLLCRIASALPNMEFLGTDLSANMLQFAEEQRQKNALSNLKFQRADMYRLNEAVEPGFDLITWHLAMHHAADADAVVRVLNQIPRLLNPGGTFFVFDINRPKTGNLALTTADIFNRRQGDWYYHDSLDSYKAAFSYEEVEDIIARSALKSVRHVQPLLGNLFQAFYLSETDNSTTHRISSLRHLWQKADYLLLELFFSSLPRAKGEVVRSDASRPRTRRESSKIASSDIIEILEIGARAMSAYNIQPWRFRWDGDEIFIYFMRHKNFFLKLEGVYYLMIGHLLENITRGAQSKGYRAEYEILSKALSIDEPCIKLRLINVDGQKQNIAYLIDRTTNRYTYSTRKIPESIKQEILNLSNHENIVIRFSEDDEKERFADILATLETIRLKNSKLVSEGLQFIDFDIQKNQRYRDRLDANAMGFGPLAISLMRETKSLPMLFTLFRVTGMLSLFICLFARPKKLLMQSGALISFSLKERSYKDYINLGIVIQAITNKIAAHNLASMPLLSGLHLLDILGENPEILSNAAKRTIRRSFDEMNELLPSQGQRVSFVMRIGYPDRIPPKTVRRNILDLIYRADQKIEA